MEIKPSTDAPGNSFGCLTSTFNQILVLSERAVLLQIRDPKQAIGDSFRFALFICNKLTISNHGIGILRHVIVGLFYGSLFYQLKGGTDPTAYSERLGVLFFAILFMVMGKI